MPEQRSRRAAPPNATPPDAAQRLRAEDAGGDAAPRAAHAVQRPDAEHVVDPPAVLREREQEHEQRARDRAGDERADRMHHVGAGADRHEPGERTVVHEARVVAADDERGDRAARHRHQRVDRDEPGDLVDASARDITLKPNQPTDSTHAPSARNGIDDGGCAAMPPSFE